MLPVLLALALPMAPADVPAPAPAQLRVLTYNVLFDGGDSDATIDLIAHSNADVVVLQEVSPGWRARIEKRKELAVFAHRFWNAKAGAYGSAILSRHKLAHEQRIDGKTAWTFALCADVDADVVVTVCGVHLKSSRSAFTGVKDPLGAFAENAKLREKQWRALLSALGDRRAIIGGDFNTAEIEPLYSMFTESGVRDPFREHALIDRGFTYPQRPFPKETLAAALPAIPMLRLDYLFTRGEGIEGDVVVVEGGGSDHRAVVGDFTVAAP